MRRKLPTQPTLPSLLDRWPPPQRVCSSFSYNSSRYDSIRRTPLWVSLFHLKDPYRLWLCPNSCPNMIILSVLLLYDILCHRIAREASLKVVIGQDDHQSMPDAEAVVSHFQAVTLHILLLLLFSLRVYTNDRKEEMGLECTLYNLY